ncbi:hypothetical protein V1477_006030 [Vespula maculifrons]|uniref:Uncharacterized protein n=1 Tax=Vespula maculifrons TaxID=7453 RepID=A0ABD2CLE8_VESMC
MENKFRFTEHKIVVTIVTYSSRYILPNLIRPYEYHLSFLGDWPKSGGTRQPASDYWLIFKIFMLPKPLIIDHNDLLKLEEHRKSSCLWIIHLFANLAK